MGFHDLLRGRLPARAEDSGQEERHVRARTVRDRLAKVAAAVLPKNFKDPKWRVMCWPGCPACQHPPELAGCGRPRMWLQAIPEALWKYTPILLMCRGLSRLDIETGLIACDVCEESQPFADAPFVCWDCGALFRGGEAWWGMRDDILEARKWQWMRSVKARTAQELLDTGWQGITRLAKATELPRCGCDAKLYRLDGRTDICGNCLQRWPS